MVKTFWEDPASLGARESLVGGHVSGLLAKKKELAGPIWLPLWI
jgi:hypothetical protein